MQITGVIGKSYLSLFPSLEKQCVAPNLILSGLGFQREKKKDFPVGRFVSGKHKPLHSDAQCQIMVITLLEQTILFFLPKTVASLNTAAPARAGDNEKREILLKIGKNQTVSASVGVFLTKTPSSPFRNSVKVQNSPGKLWNGEHRLTVQFAQDTVCVQQTCV